MKNSKTKLKSSKKVSQSDQGRYTPRLSNTSASGFHEAFRMDHDFFRQLVGSLEDYAVFTTDKDGFVSSWNSGAERLLGYSEKEVIGKNASIFYTPEDVKKNIHIKELKKAVTNGRAQDERWHLKKGGKRMWGSGLVFPLRDEDGSIRGFTKVMRDRTQQRKIEQNQENFHQLAEAIPQIVFTATGENISEYFNKRWFEYTGLQRTFNPNDWTKVIHPADLPGVLKKWNEVEKNGEVFEAEYRIKRYDGVYRWFLGRSVPIKNEKGEIIKWFGTATDIDDRKQIEGNLRYLAEASKIFSASLNYQQTLYDIAQIAVPHIADWCAIYLVNQKGVTEQVALTHVDPKKIKWAKKLQKQYPPDPNAKTGLPQVIRSCQSEIYPFIPEELLVKSAKDETHLKIIKKLALRSAMTVPILREGKALGAISFITTAESGREYSNSDLAMAEELASRAALAIVNAKLYNSAEQEIEARKKTEEQLKKSEAQFRALVEANIVGVVRGNIKGEIYDANDAFLHMIGYSQEDLKNRRLRWDKLTPPEFVEISKKAIIELKKTGRAAPYEKEFIKKDGSQVPVIVGLSDLGNGEALAFIVDITERKKLEQRKDEFIGIASHELKTPLTSIKGYTQILERIIHQMGDEKLKTYLKKTSTYIDRLNSLIADLLDVSKIQAGKLQMDFSTFNFDDLVKDGIETMQHTNSQHKIILEGKTNQGIKGDRHRLEQVFTNLLSNAIKYSPQADKVIVKVSKEKESIKVGISDYGVGIPKEKLPMLFDRFYRVEETSKKFSGLGIGLYISHEIVNRHGGRMWVESKLGKGSTFFFTLPIKQ